LLGEIKLFTFNFPLLVLDTHFTELEAGSSELKLNLKELQPDLKGILIRSQPVQERLERISVLEDWIRYVPAQYQRFHVDLQGSFSDYLKKFSPKSRSTLRRKVRRFIRFSQGRLDWQEFKKFEDMDEFYRLAREISKTTYQERLLDVGLPDDEDFRQQLNALARRDLIRGYILFHDGTPIAYLFCTVREGGILLYRYLGFDPQYQVWSPGTVLHYLVLEKLFNEGDLRMLDFTEGEGPQKRFFSTGSTRCADVFYFRRTGLNYFILYLHTAADLLSASIVRFLTWLGLKGPVKRLFRTS
jgi:hypothetical protein